MNIFATVEMKFGGPGSGRRPGFVYHVTPASNVKSILKSGIHTGGGNHGTGVYAFVSHGEAKGYFGSFGHPQGTAVVQVKDRGQFREVSHGALISDKPVSKKDVVAVHLYDGGHKANFIKTLTPRTK